MANKKFYTATHNNKTCFMIVNGKFVVKGDSKLATPVISKSGTTLTINDVPNATSYKIYQNETQIGEVTA